MGADDEEEDKKTVDNLIKGASQSAFIDTFSPVPLADPFMQDAMAFTAEEVQSLMEVPEMEEPNLIPRISPEEREALVAANRLPPGALTPKVTSPRQTRVPVALGSRGYNQRLRDRFPELFGAQLAAADGGEVFPRRTGGIMPDEGIPGKDSVKALVMPGEFIFTTNAVKGAGNGDLQRGINNMYGVMRNLEARGARMA